MTFALRAAFAGALACGLTAAFTAPAVAQAQPTPPVGPDFSKIEVKAVELGRGIYMLEGSGGNVTLAVGRDGAIMVDGQFAPMHDKLVAAIGKLTDKPVKYLINTHFHGDHTGGNDAFAKDGVTIVAHQGVKDRLAAGTTSNVTGAKTPPRPDALPKIVYRKKLKLKLKGRRAALAHPDNAHTDGDTFVYFADTNVLSTGDTFTNGRYPNIDFLNGGSIRGMIRALDLYLSFIDDKTKVVPGHGPLGNRVQVAEFRAMLATASERMAKLKKEGKTEEQIQTAKPFADLDGKWAMNDQAARNFVRVVYNAMK